eukprot:422114-Amphidinium_carterae.1
MACTRWKGRMLFSKPLGCAPDSGDFRDLHFYVPQGSNVVVKVAAAVRLACANAVSAIYSEIEHRAWRHEQTH